MNFRAFGGGHSCSSITWDCRGELMFAYSNVVKSLIEIRVLAIPSGDQHSKSPSRASVVFKPIS